jgi:hypothetical protein
MTSCIFVHIRICKVLALFKIIFTYKGILLKKMWIFAKLILNNNNALEKIIFFKDL